MAESAPMTTGTGPLFNLESALIDVGGVMHVLRELGCNDATDLGESLIYLANQLHEHIEAAMEAFTEIAHSRR
jgi:hypothetical protein